MAQDNFYSSFNKFAPFILCWVDFLSFINDLKQNPSMKSENILGELSHSFPVFTGYSADDNGQLFSAWKDQGIKTTLTPSLHHHKMSCTAAEVPVKHESPAHDMSGVLRSRHSRCISNTPNETVVYLDIFSIKHQRKTPLIRDKNYLFYRKA